MMFYGAASRFETFLGGTVGGDRAVYSALKGHEVLTRDRIMQLS